MNYGIDLNKELQDQSQEDWVFGAASALCITAKMPEGERVEYLPKGEVQRGREDMMDCASRSVVNILETKFNFLLRNKLISPANEVWLRDNGYVTENGVEFSDAFVAINSGTTRNGNSLKAPLEAVRTEGLVPKRKLPLQSNMTFEDYHNPERISGSLRALGIQFRDRFTINYERVLENDYREILKTDLLNVAGFAWPNPKKGEYPRTDKKPNHAFMVIKTPAFYIFDNYIDSDQDFIKKLASDYNFLDYGYRVYITKESAVSVNWIMELLKSIADFLTASWRSPILTEK